MTLAFLIAGALIVAALTFWSGPDVDKGPATGESDIAATLP